MTGLDTTMKRLVAHSGSPYRLSQATGVVKTLSSPTATREATEKRLAAMTNRKYCLLTTSGRYSLYLILKAVSEISERKNVIVPAYTCPSVINAVIRSGLTPVLCDLKSGTFDYDFLQLRKIITAETVAVVAVNLCGQLCNFRELDNIGREKKVMIIEDACQSLGGSYQQEPSGGFGTFSFVSFGFSKNLALGNGGAVLTNDTSCYQALQRSIDPAPSGRTRQVIFLWKWFAFLILMRPRLYYLLRLLPHAFEDENFGFSLAEEGRMPDCQTRLLFALLGQMVPLTDRRRANARLLYQNISGLPGIGTFPETVADGNAALRFPLLIENSDQRKRLLATLRKSGIEADPFYALRKQVFFRRIRETAPVASSYTERLLTLPTHRYVDKGDINTIFTICASGVGWK